MCSTAVYFSSRQEYVYLFIYLFMVDFEILLVNLGYNTTGSKFTAESITPQQIDNSVKNTVNNSLALHVYKTTAKKIVKLSL
jgi:hypothetical protein